MKFIANRCHIKQFLAYLIAKLREAAKISLRLFKVMVPVVIIVKMLQEYGLIHHLSLHMAPLMDFVGLAPALGLVWATAMITNLYGAMVVFATLYPELSLTAQDVTVLATLCLVAHNLPIEVMVAKLVGVRVWLSVAVRILSAIALAKVTHLYYSHWQWGQESATLIWQPSMAPQSLAEWALQEATHLAYIALIIYALLIIMDGLKVTGVTDLFSKVVLKPLLRLCGIGQSATMVTLAGVTMGLAYGGGMILKEIKATDIDHKDIFCAVIFMSLSHAIIEDTLLMMLIGADVVGILWGRLLFTICVIALLSRIVLRLPEMAFYRYCYKPIA